LAINESAGPAETEHFMRTFNDATFGIGSIIPLLLLYSSVIEGALGTCLWYYINYKSISHAIVVLFALGSITSIFIFFSLQICSCLYVSRRTSKAIAKIDETTLSPTEIHDIYQSYLTSVGGFAFIGTEDKFIDYLRVNCGGAGYKCKLAVMTENICRRYFNAKFHEIITNELRRIPGWKSELEQLSILPSPSSQQKSSPNLAWTKPMKDEGEAPTTGNNKRPSSAYNKVVPIDSSIDHD
jgi:hypothetical protein